MKSACEKRKTRVCQTYCMFSITSSVSVWRNRRNRSHRRSRAIARRSDLPGASSVHPCRGSGGDGDGGGAGGSRIVPRGSGPPSDLLLWCLLARRYQRSLLPYRRHCNETSRRWVFSDNDNQAFDDRHTNRRCSIYLVCLEVQERDNVN